jgi:hydrocephalus-inducing protein
MTLTQKSYGIFNIEFKPTEPGVKVWEIICATLLNQFESFRFKIEGEAYSEDILFENLPLEEEDKINFGDCIIKEEKRLNFSIKNNNTEAIKFQWGFHEDFTFLPKVGHINRKSSKAITVVFKSDKTISHKDLTILC